MSPTITRRASLAGLLALAGCSPVNLLNATIRTGGITVERNLAYGEGPRHRLDVYRPRTAPAGPRPTIVFFYGGRWQFGVKEDYLFVGQALASAGFTAIIPDYRLFPEVDWRGFLDDGQAAILWAQREAARLGGDPATVFLAGHSAGAYIASMLALDPGRALPTRLRGLIGISGPYDFLPPEDADVKAIFASGTPANAQAVGVVTADAPPTLLLHGDADDTVRPRNSQSLAQHLQALGVPVELKLYPGTGHIRIITAMASPLRWQAPTLADLSDFVRRQSA